MKRKKKRKEQAVSRRDMLKWGALSGSAVLLSARSYRSIAQSGSGGGGSGTGAENTSPATTPFAVALPIPPTKTPLAAQADLAQAGNGGILNNGRVHPQLPNTHPDNPAMQRFSQFPVQKYYVLKVQQFNHVFHPQLPASPLWGYDGMFPGPTFKSRYREPILVRIINNLPGGAAAGGFGNQQISTHLHNGHTASESDGFPCDFYPRPEDGLPNLKFRDHHYAMFRAGLAAGTPGNAVGADGDPNETLSTLWYHDHAEEFTAQNVYKGLAGFHIFYGKAGSTAAGDEDQNDETKGYRLPAGNFDVPLFFQDKKFKANGQLFLDTMTTDGFLGDKFTVNGKIQPYFNVQRRKYRFRVLNGGPSRFYQFYLTKNNVDQNFFIIGHDETLLEGSITRKAFGVVVSERVDIVINFANFNTGDELFLVNRLVMREDGRGPTGDILPPGQGDKVMKFIVGGNAADPSQVPAVLRPAPVLPPNILNNPNIPKRFFKFDRSGGIWTVNGEVFDCDENNGVTPKKRQGFGPTVLGEVWTFENSSGGWAHPIHPHLEEFRVILRKGKPPAALADSFDGGETTKEDVLDLGPNAGEVKVFMRFRDWLGKYPMHCHNVIHEDHAMMIRFDVVP